MVRIIFRSIGYSAKKTGKCIVCGKQCSRSNKFYQTQNPFNKNANGEIKTEDEIYKELGIEEKLWRKSPMMHEKCQSNK
jgi:hypothetical protein